MIFSAEEVIRVGMPIGNIPDYYPNWFWNNQTGKYEGFFIDYLDAVFENLDMKYSIVENYLNYGELVDALVEDKFDIIYGDITIDEKRVGLIDFSVPIQTSNLIIIKRKSNTVDTSYFSFLFPLSYEVWAAVLTAMFTGL